MTGKRIFLFIFILSWSLAVRAFAFERISQWEQTTVMISSMAGVYIDTREGQQVKTPVGPMSKCNISGGHGSGVIISSDGLIATNRHVVEGGEALTVRLYDNRVFAAKIVYVDPKEDIAFIVIKGENLPHLSLNNENINKNILKGEKVFAVGFPLDPTQTEASLTEGIVSRWHKMEGEVKPKIQVSAPINHGNSGGPVFDGKGKLVGIAFAKIEGAENYNFVIPVIDVLASYDSMEKKVKYIAIRKDMEGYSWDLYRTYALNMYDFFVGKQENLTGKMDSLIERKYADAYILAAAFYWNNGVEKFKSGKIQEGKDFMRDSNDLVKKAISIKQSLKDNSFVDFVLSNADNIERMK